MFEASELFTLEETLARDYILALDYPWQGINEIKDIILHIGEDLNKNGEYVFSNHNVWIHKEAEIASTAYIGPFTIIGKGTQVRHCAYIRGCALIGDECVIGNSTEVKNSLIFNRVQLPHFNYVGDSILGYKAHLGAGAIISNVKSDKSAISIKERGKITRTGLRKFGALIGDNVEIGCNSVIFPGTIIGKASIVYPLSRVRGVLKEKSIMKNEHIIIEKR